ncbi:MAG: NADH-quinone oxidoreductase subunit A [Deltaproteobacteria bacterium]|nr:NADH-quinone oxidoreductase subunit A [Deltaproteobacteria bacterium]
MLVPYAGVALMIAVAIALAAVFLLGSIYLGPRAPNPVKSEPWECGTVSVGSVRRRFSVRFYLIALLFVVFDVEIVFLFPWAVLARELGWAGFSAMAVFVAVLGLGLAYVWKRGALEWE